MSIASPVTGDTRLVRPLVYYTETVEGEIYSRAGPPPDWRQSVQTIQQLPAEGHIDFYVPVPVVGAIVGLGAEDSVYYPALTHALRFSRGFVQPVELGVLKSSAASFLDSDLFTIQIVGTTVTYRKNGTTFYTSLAAATGTTHRPYAFLYTVDDAVWNLTVTSTLAGSQHGTAALQLHKMQVRGARGSSNVGKVQLGILRTDSITSEFVIRFNRGAVDLRAMQVQASAPSPLNNGYLKFNPLHVFGATTADHTGALGVGHLKLKPMRVYGSGQMRIDQHLMFTAGINTAFTNLYELRLSIAGVLGAHMLSVGITTIQESIVAALKINDRLQLMRLVLSIIQALNVHDITDAHVGLLNSIIGRLSPQQQFIVRAVLRATLYTQLGVSEGPGIGVLDTPNETWNVNVEKGNNPRPGLGATTASSRYENYDFNSMMFFRGSAYGTRPDGLYLLEGDDDDGMPIRASLNFGKLRFGNSKLKAVPAAYVGASSTGELYLRVVQAGKEFVYKARNADTEMTTQRFDLGRGLRSNYFDFELFNGPGHQMEIDSIEFIQVPLDRRIK